MNRNYNFMALRRPALSLSAVLVLASLAFLFTRGLNLGIDFTGGKQRDRKSVV